jgi:hypothetical protein
MPLDLQAFRAKLPISQQGQESLDSFRRLLSEFGKGSVPAHAVVAAHGTVPRLQLTPAEHGQYALVLLIVAAAAQQRRPSRRQRQERLEEEEEEDNDDDRTTTTIVPWWEVLTESFLRTIGRLRDFPTVVRPFFRNNNNNDDDSKYFDILAGAIQTNPFHLPQSLAKMTNPHDDDISNKSWLLLFSYFAVRLGDDLKIGDDDDDEEIGNTGSTKPPMIIMDELLSSVLYYREAAALVQVDNFLLHPFRATDTLITAWSSHVAPAPSPRYVYF